MLEDFQGDSWGSIPPLHMSSLLPHDLCHGRSASLWPPTVSIAYFPHVDVSESNLILPSPLYCLIQSNTGGRPDLVYSIGLGLTRFSLTLPGSISTFLLWVYHTAWLYSADCWHKYSQIWKKGIGEILKVFMTFRQKPSLALSQRILLKWKVMIS